MLRSIFTAIFLFALWYLMSGIDKTLTLVLGAGSSVFAIWIVRRMDEASNFKCLSVHLRPIEFGKYIFWVLAEIAKSNWTVIKIVLSPNMDIKQKMYEVPFTQKSDLGQAVFANTITLTPGTITVEVEADHFLVHGLSYSFDDHAALAEMDRRVSKTEGIVDL